MAGATKGEKNGEHMIEEVRVSRQMNLKDRPFEVFEERQQAGPYWLPEQAHYKLEELLLSMAEQELVVAVELAVDLAERTGRFDVPRGAQQLAELR